MARTTRYKKDLILDNKLKKETVYTKDKTKFDVISLSGEFSQLSGGYVIAAVGVPNVILPNQAINTDSHYYDMQTMNNCNRYMVFESSTGDLYCTDNFLYIIYH